MEVPDMARRPDVAALGPWQFLAPVMMTSFDFSRQNFAESI